jgi:NHLM bacteriocin system ABC transporter ATP-binding protein
MKIQPDLLCDDPQPFQDARVQDTRKAFEQFQERQRRNGQMRVDTLGVLASILERQTNCMPLRDGPPLFAAARAVADTLGIALRSPAASEDLSYVKDPLAAIARASHVRLRRVKLTGTWWRHDGGPLIAYTRKDHSPVALLPVSASRYDLFNPVSRTRTPVQAQLAATLESDAYILYRPFPNTVCGWLSVLRFGLRGRAKDLLTLLLTGLVATLLGMLTPQATAILIDTAIPDSDRSIVLQLSLMLFAAACGQGLFQLAQGFALLRQHTASGAAVQTAMWDRLLKLKPSFFRQYTTGDLQARVSAITTIQQKLNGATLRTLFASILALLNLSLMLAYNVRLTLVAIIVALVASLATVVASVLTVRHVRPLQRLTGELLGTVVQLIHGVAKLRVAGAEERAFAYWGRAFSQQQILRRRVQLIEDLMMVVNTVLPTLASVVLFWFAMRALQPPSTAGSQAIGTGTFLAFNAAFGTFIGGVTMLSNTIVDLLEVATLWERAKPILVAPPEVDIAKAHPGQLTGQLALDHVTFRYRQQGPVVLHDVSLRAEPGEFIALVGRSGSGKSTILRLLLGFDVPETGAVYYDDQELCRLDITEVRRQAGTVLQQSSVMASTIFENIAGGRLITQDEAWEAACAAGLAEDIATMPMGLYTFVSEGGGNLSGGQRQRLLIARALAHKPVLVFFDEATSALDNYTQAVVSASLDQLQATRVVIAHRLSTIRHADRIYVLDAGQVVQQGNFTELTNQKGLFAQLIARQEL